MQKGQAIVTFLRVFLDLWKLSDDHNDADLLRNKGDR